MAHCRNEQEVLSEKFLSLEAYSRRNNLGFDGIAETDGEILEQKIHQLFADMKLDPKIQLTACHRFGPRTQKKNIHRSIMVKFLKYSDRNAVWRARSVLHGQNIYVKEDFPAEIEKRRQILRPYLRAAFQGGDPSNPNGRVSAYLKHDSLIVNNQAFKCNMTDSLPEYIQHRVQNPPAEIETDKVFLFFTQSSEFSNFYPSDIDILDGTTFNSVEQYMYVSYSKAKLFEESQEFVDEIMAMNDPKEMKQKVKRLSKYDGQVWVFEAPTILQKALKAKFSQNLSLKSKLLSTNDKIVGEASSNDTHFGIGLSLNNRNARDPSKWRGMNLQGLTLMEVRQFIKNGHE